MERFFRTLKEQLPRVRDFTTSRELAEGARKIPPAAQRLLAAGKAQLSIPAAGSARGCLPSRLLHDDIQKTVQETGCGTLPKILSFEARQHLNIAEICLDLWVFPMQKQGRGGGFSSLNRQFHRPANGCLPRCLQR